MPTPNFNNLVLRFSQYLFDPRTVINESDATHDITQAMLVTALNNAGRDFVNLLAKQKAAEIAEAVPEHIKEEAVTITGGIGDKPSNSIKGIALTGSNWSGIYTKPEEYRASKFMNPEEIGSTESPRWTEFNNKIYMSDERSTNATYMYLYKYAAVTIDGANDTTIPDRFDTQILDLAVTHIEKLFPVNRGGQQ